MRADQANPQKMAIHADVIVKVVQLLLHNLSIGSACAESSVRMVPFDLVDDTGTLEGGEQSSFGNLPLQAVLRERFDFAPGFSQTNGQERGRNQRGNRVRTR